MVLISNNEQGTISERPLHHASFKILLKAQPNYYRVGCTLPPQDLRKSPAQQKQSTHVIDKKLVCAQDLPSHTKTIADRPSNQLGYKSGFVV